jgi:hypothetical protein
LSGAADLIDPSASCCIRSGVVQMFRWNRWLKKTFRSAQQLRPSLPHPHAFQPMLEEFEARVVPTTVTVTSATDDPTDTGSLRYILEHATAGEMIDFASTVRSITLSTQSGANTTGLVIGTDVTIVNDQGSGSVTIDGGGATTGFSVFTVDSRVTASISGLTITNGRSAAEGGGINNNGTLTVSSSTFSNNSATDSGGGIFNSSTLTVSNCTLSNNSGILGGGIYNVGMMTVSDSTLSNNSTSLGGGGIYSHLASTTLNGDIVVGNTDTSGPDDVDGTGPVSTASENLIGADLTSSLTNGVNGNLVGVTVAQAGLAPLGYYGGPTQTFALLPGSFAIGKGLVSGAGDTDERGMARPSGVQGDVGAFQTTSLAVNTTDSSGPVALGELSLRDAVNIVDADTVTGSPEPITFDPTVFATAQTITLNSGTLTLGSSGTVAPISIAGPAAGLTIDGNNACTVFQVNSNVTASLSGLTIAHGKASLFIGGGILNSGTLTVTNSTFSNNSATFDGGGILNSGTLTITNSTFSNNSAGDTGGGIANGGTLTLTNSTFANNSASSDFAGSGGGISNDGTLTVTNSTFSNNSANGSFGSTGGGIFNFIGTLTVTNSTFANNSASGNSGGGGIYNVQGTLTVTNSTFSNNSAVVGGGISILNCTTTLNGDIVVGNTDASGNDDIAGSGLDSTSSDNLIGANLTSSLTNGVNGNQVGVTVAQAGLAPLGYYGGPTQTFALLPGSFAIGKGITANTGDTDERGMARPSGVQGDVGAFQTTSLAVNTTTDSSGAVAFGQLSLRDALNIVDTDTVTGSPEPITFDPIVFATAQTITLNSGALTLGSPSSVAPSSITGPSAGVVIDGNNTSTIFSDNCGAPTTLSGLTITDGNAGNGAGGGIFNNGVVIVSNCTFSNNSSNASYGGGIFNQTGTLTLSNCTFVNNSAAFGGGILNDGILTISNCTFANNSADDGGGIFNDSGKLTVSNCTFSNNSITDTFGGGGIFSGNTPSLNGDILVGNTDAIGNDDFNGDALDSTSSDNLIGVDLTRSLANGVNGNLVGVTVAQAGLAPLGDYGGPTQTFALARGSLALGKGLTASAAGTDQRGVARPINQPGDIGAFQLSAPPMVTTNPTSQTITAPATVSFTAVATDTYTDGTTPPLTVQWQISTDGGHTFSNLTNDATHGGVTSDTLTITAETSLLNGYEYRAVFTNPIGQTATTQAATLTVMGSPIVTSNPVNQEIVTGGSCGFSASALDGNPAPTFVQWQISTDGGNTFINLGPSKVFSGVNTTTLTITGATTGMNGDEFQALFSNPLNLIAVTAPATLTVDYAPTITNNPSNSTVNAGNSTSFTAAAGGNATPSVQWEVSTDGGSTFNAILPGGIYGNSVTSPTLTITGASDAMNGNLYEAVFTNSLGTATTKAATLTVDSAPAVTTNPSNATVNAGNSTTFTAAASGNTTPTVRWAVSTDGGNTFSDLAPGGIYGNSVNTPTLTITHATAAMNGNLYEAVFTNSLGTATSAQAKLTIDVPPVITGNTAAQLIDDNTTIKPFQSVWFSDPDSSTETHTVTVTLSAAANGTLSNLGGGTYDPTTGVFTLNNVTLAQAQSALRALTFTPTAHQVLPGQTLTTGFTLSISDDGGTITDSTTSVVTTDTLSNLGPVVSSGGNVEIFTLSGNLLETLTPFGKGATVSVTTDDVNGDGVSDIIVATARRGGQIGVYDGITGQPLKTFAPYGSTYTSGLNVAIGDVLGNGHQDLIVAPGGANKRVKVIDPTTGAMLASFFPFTQKYPTHAYTGGARVAAGDLAGTGQAEVVVGTATPQSGYAEVWKCNGSRMVQTGQHISLASHGVFLATGTFTPGHADLIVGSDSQPAPGSNARLLVVDGESFKAVAALPTSSPALSVFSNGNREAVRVAVRDLTGDGVPDVVVATGKGSTQEVRVFDFTGSTLVLEETLTASELGLTSTAGLYVA